MDLSSAATGSSPASESLLEVRRLSKSYPLSSGFFGGHEARFHALREVSFSIAAGETVGLIGESGSGKSTVARIIARLLRADSGEVLLQGREILRLSTKAFAAERRQIQMIFQDPNSSLNPRFTMEQTLNEPLIGFKLGDAKQRGEKIREMLPVVGLDESILSRYPQQLSGGQKQRVAILGVLLVDPQLIIADEIVSALDLSVQAQILNLWRELQQRFRRATLFISHDLQVVGWLADRILVMHSGQIVEAGTSAEICLHPQHPYTKLLFAARETDLEHREAELQAAMNGGCAFYPRCPERRERCRNIAAELKQVAPDHMVRCHLWD